jgi:hypothetical protein
MVKMSLMMRKKSKPKSKKEKGKAREGGINIGNNT